MEMLASVRKLHSKGILSFRAQKMTFILRGDAKPR